MKILPKTAIRWFYRAIQKNCIIKPHRGALKKVRPLALGLLFLSLGGLVSLRADVVYLKSGRILLGQTLSASGALVRFRHKGRTLTFEKAVVRKIFYGSKEEKKIRAARARRKAAWLRKRKKLLEKKKTIVKPVTEFDFKEKVQKRDVATGLVSPWAIVARSAVVPGWGHLAMDSYWLGWTYMIGSGALLSRTLYLQNLAQRARADYRRSVIYQNQIIFGLPGAATPKERVALAFALNGRDYNKSRLRVSDYNQSLGFVLMLYSFQLLHAAFDAFSFGEDANWDIGFRTESSVLHPQFTLGASKDDGRLFSNPFSGGIEARFRFFF